MHCSNTDQCRSESSVPGKKGQDKYELVSSLAERIRAQKGYLIGGIVRDILRRKGCVEQAGQQACTVADMVDRHLVPKDIDCVMEPSRVGTSVLRMDAPFWPA